MLNALTITIAGLILVLSGCAATPKVPVAMLPAAVLWHDVAFDYDPSSVSISKADLFALDPELVASLGASDIKVASFKERTEYLATLLFGPERKSFPYAGGQSTIGAVTWRTKRGDCLSLSVLAYSLARELNLPAQLQEVSVQPFYDRHGGVDFVEGHVNVLIKTGVRPYVFDHEISTDFMVIDFEPRVGRMREGIALSEANVLARYYNNIAAEHFAKNDLRLAYAWFKAAILADQTYSSSYSNLAQLYKRAGFTDGAERLLQHALALNSEDRTAPYSLQLLLTAQGRETEAAQYARIVQARRERSPYYWIGLGMDYLRSAQYGSAVRALERAESLAAGFDEVHRNLAIAYWYNGDKPNAKKQLDMLASLIMPDKVDAGFTALSRKIGKM